MYVAVIAAIFPSIEGSPSISDLLESYPDAVKSLFGLAGGVDIGSGAGFVDAELFSFMLPLFAIALAIGAAWPSRAAAIGIPAALAAGAYLVGGLHGLASWLDPLRFASSFWWIGQSPLSNGVQWWRFLVVAAVTGAILVAASRLIDRRDLETP